jgi:pyruvate/2-oxoglutarate dehydrogenase complex dihydrolipoamide acyltransferase (E2) component
VPTFHYMDEVEADGLLSAREALRGDAAALMSAAAAVSLRAAAAADGTPAMLDGTVSSSPPPPPPPPPRLTFLPFVMKALSLTMHAHPVLNSTLEPGGGALLQRQAHNIGVAMATPAGLVVPNVKGVRVCVTCGK